MGILRTSCGLGFWAAFGDGMRHSKSLNLLVEMASEKFGSRFTTIYTKSQGHNALHLYVWYDEEESCKHDEAQWNSKNKNTAIQRMMNESRASKHYVVWKARFDYPRATYQIVSKRQKTKWESSHKE